MKTRHLLMLLLLAMMPLAASAYDFEVDGLYYEKTGEGEVSVVKGDKAYEGAVVIPSSIEVGGVTYAVKAVGRKAFEFSGNLNSVVLSEGIESIGDDAFVTCTMLESVTLPSTLRSIGQDAFYASSRLTEIELPEGLERIARGAFHYSGIKEIVIPSTVSKIEGGFICGFPYMSEDLPGVQVQAVRVADGNPYYHTAPNGTGVIETETQRLVQAVAGIVIPDEVTAIGADAFFYCSVPTLTLPKGFKSLESCAFECVDNLTSLYSCSKEPPTITRNSFGGTAMGERELRLLCTLYVPTGCVEAYKSAGWGGFKDVKEFDPESMGDPTGISAAETGVAGVEACFSADGKRLQAPVRGLNIVRMSDGTTKKVVMK